MRARTGDSDLRKIFVQAVAVILTIGSISGGVHADTTITPMITGLDEPWGIDHLPDGSLLITEKDGRVLLWKDGQTRALGGAPDVVDRGQGGLLDVAVARDFASSRTIFSAIANARTGVPVRHLPQPSYLLKATAWKTFVICSRLLRAVRAAGTLDHAWSRLWMAPCL